MLRIKPLISLLIWAGVATLLAIGEGDSEGVQPLRLVVQPSLQYRFTDVWHNTPPQYGPSIAVADRITLGQRVDLQVVILDPDISSKSEWTYTIIIHGPNEESVDPGHSLELLSDRASKLMGPMLAKESISWTADSDDDLGERTVEVIATDAHSGRSARASTTFEVVSAAELISWESVENHNQWFQRYCIAPTPHHFPGYLSALMADPKLQKMDLSKVDRFGAMLGAFEVIWEENPWLREHFIERLNGTNDRLARHLAGLIAFALRNDPKTISNLPARVQKLIAKYGSTRWPEPFDPSRGGVQLDVLWGRFFAGGHVQPLRDLVAVLDEPVTQSLSPKAALRRRSLLGATIWSLSANSRSHPLVRAYLIAMVNDPKISAQQKEYLIEALQSKDPNSLREKYLTRAK